MRISIRNLTGSLTRIQAGQLPGVSVRPNIWSGSISVRLPFAFIIRFVLPCLRYGTVPGELFPGRMEAGSIAPRTATPPIVKKESSGPAQRESSPFPRAMYSAPKLPTYKEASRKAWVHDKYEEAPKMDSYRPQPSNEKSRVDSYRSQAGKESRPSARSVSISNKSSSSASNGEKQLLKRPTNEVVPTEISIIPEDLKFPCNTSDLWAYLPKPSEELMEKKAIELGIRSKFFKCLEIMRFYAKDQHQRCSSPYIRNWFADHLTWKKLCESIQKSKLT